jgi:dihydrofolate reductase
MQNGAFVFGSLEEALEYCRKKNEEKVFIIGGSSVYATGMDMADTLEITKIYKSFQGDTAFPPISKDEWEIEDKEDIEAIDIKSNEKVKLSFLRYTRRK